MLTMRSESSQDGITDGEALDALSAARFLEGQASTLRDAIARPGCASSMGRALRRQDSAHEAWLALLGESERGGRRRLVLEIADLYRFHGRAAGILERGFHPLLHPAVERRMRILLIAQLQRLTARAVDCLVTEALAATPREESRPATAPCMSRRRVGSWRA